MSCNLFASSKKRGIGHTQKPRARPITHVVRKGQTLSRIAQQYGTDFQAIAQANGIRNPSNIYVGQRLKVPDAKQMPIPSKNLQPKPVDEKSVPDETGISSKGNGCECSGMGQDSSMNNFSKSTQKRISRLNPKIQTSTKKFLNHVRKKLGINLIVTQGYRSIAEQNALYAKGRTAPGKKVTNARGGSSYHNYGLAIDVVELKNGKLNWNTKWKEIGKIGKCYGFEWGGDWKTILDRPHFQMRFGLRISDLRRGKRP